MALLEISELMYDPDFADTFVVTRNAVSINNYGESVVTPTSFTATGSVQPATARVYQIFPDMTRISGSIEIYTTTALTCVSVDPLESDQITWNGLVYVVQAIADDFSNWGPGYYVALCALQDLLSASPTTLPSSDPT